MKNMRSVVGGVNKSLHEYSLLLYFTVGEVHPDLPASGAVL